MKTSMLCEEHRVAIRVTRKEDIDELIRHGVAIEAIAAVCPACAPIALDRDGDRYWPDDTGCSGWIVPARVVDPASELIETVDPLHVISRGPVIDLVAFRPDQPGYWALRLGLATVLGAVQLQDADADPVIVHFDVMDWLRAGCSGIVLLTSDPMEVNRILRQCARVAFHRFMDRLE
jgi:hypothetical protein